MKTKIVVSLACVVLVVTVFAVWTRWQYHNASEVELSDGTVVRDVSAAEAGMFAGEEFEPLRLMHYERVHSLRDAPRVAIADTGRTREVVAPLIADALGDNPAGARVLASAGPGVEDGLVDLVARVIAVVSGAELESYLASHPNPDAIGEPIALPLVEEAAVGYSLTHLMPPEGAPAEAWRPIFEALYELARADRGGERLTRAVLSRPASFFVAVGPDYDPDRAPKSVLEFQLGRAAGNEFFASTSQGLPNFFVEYHDHDGGGHDHVGRAESGVLEANVAFYVEDRSGDVYPMAIIAEHDEQTGTWTLAGVYRFSSLRAMGGPPFVF